MRDQSCSSFNKYGPYLAHLEKKYSEKGIKFIYNYTSQTKKENHSEDDLKKNGLKSPYVIDNKHTTVNALSANSAGEIFILTPERRIIYKGPLDNQYYWFESIFNTKQEYVADFLKKIVSGEKIIPKEFPVRGCVIPRFFLPKRKFFYGDVAPIIRKKCTICHNSKGTGPIDYMSYEDVAGRRSMFKYVIEHDLMPPWQLDPNTGPWDNNISLTAKEKAMLLKWVDDGCPRKSGKKDLLSIRTKKSTNQNMIPDYVISLPETVKIPTGAPKYIRFLIEPNFTEDKWIRGLRFTLKPKVIHHSVIHIIDPLRSLDPSYNIRNRSLMYKYIINSMSAETYTVLSNNIGINIPRKAAVIWEIHYDPQGQKVVDNFSQVHFFFHKYPPKYQSFRLNLDTKDINILPYQSNYKATASYYVEQDLHITSIGPHMHLRGKASSVIFTNPKAVTKRIFGMNRFLWNLEKKFRFKDPLLIPKGSVLKCVNWFDNSENNKWNPAPQKHITYGLYKKDEMSTCFLYVIYPAAEKYPVNPIRRISQK